MRPSYTHALKYRERWLMIFTANKLPEVPAYNITKLNFEEVDIPGAAKKAMAADVSLKAFNKYPVQLDIPQLAFEILVPNCAVSDPYILIADATTEPVAIRPQTDVVVNARGLVRELPESLTRICPNSDSSPLDQLLRQYVKGEAATVFVRGKKGGDTPDWLGEILSSVTVPIPFPGHSFDGFVRQFALNDVHFTLPDPFAEPGDPDANPKISANIVVTAALPAEMNFDVNVTKVRATSDVFYKHKKLGELNLKEWQPANSTKIEAKKGEQEAMLKIQAKITDAPLNVTDEDVFTEVVQALLFGGKEVNLKIEALVDVQIKTVLGALRLKDIPATGKVPVKRPYQLR
jgi:hypothetical protein